jgi:hypothetical protein
LLVGTQLFTLFLPVYNRVNIKHLNLPDRHFLTEEQGTGTGPYSSLHFLKNKIKNFYCNFLKMFFDHALLKSVFTLEKINELSRQ